MGSELKVRSRKRATADASYHHLQECRRRQPVTSSRGVVGVEDLRRPALLGIGLVRGWNAHPQTLIAVRWGTGNLPHISRLSLSCARETPDVKSKSEATRVASGPCSLGPVTFRAPGSGHEPGNTPRY